MDVDDLKTKEVMYPIEGLGEALILIIDCLNQTEEKEARAYMSTI